ncbi:MAG: hypothetical protein KC933_22760 [Myxococcales bacterium]|nr:hypothetical protein [Myxococcales bacterium]
MKQTRFTFPNAAGEELSALLMTPDHGTHTYALFAHCFTCSKDSHAAARISRLLAEAGRPEDADRYRKVTQASSIRETVEGILSQSAAHLTPRFIPAHMTWGAINELTAAAAYGALIETTKNPVLAELLRRIVKQERKHYSFYFKQAHKRLEDDSWAQALTRFVIKRFWTVVGSGVGGWDNLGFIAALHFDTHEKRAPLRDAEATIQGLPGMEWFNILDKQVARLAETYVARHGAPVAA